MSPFFQENREKPIKLLARTFFKELRANGYSERHVLTFSSELIDCLNQELEREQARA